MNTSFGKKVYRPAELSFEANIMPITIHTSWQISEL